MSAIINRQTGRLEVGDALYTASVLTRHNPDCAEKDKKNNAHCNCPKAILTYDSTTKTQKRESAHTRSWEKAMAKAEEWLNQYDPTKIEQKRKEASTVTVQKAVEIFLNYKAGQTKNTLNYEGLLGGGKIVRKSRSDNKLIDFLATQNPPVQLVSDVTSIHLLEWQAKLRETRNDLSLYMDWGFVKEFFTFCVTHKWITENPAAGIKRPKYKKGNRTVAFSDQQYRAIQLEAQTSGDRRLEAILELMRWSGMALVDAVVFDPTTLDSKNVLRYHREKTNNLAVVKLPNDVAELVRNLPADEKFDPAHPFRHKGLDIRTDKGNWRADLQELFAKAGITEVKAPANGMRKPHPHMLRDTCAVWYLRHGMGITSVAKVLGDSVKVVEQHYMPWIKELEDAHIDLNAAILANAKLI